MWNVYLSDKLLAIYSYHYNIQQNKFSKPNLKGLQSSVHIKRSTTIKDLSNNNHLSGPLTH